MIAVIGAFNQEKALVGTFFVIVNIRDPSFEALVCKYLPSTRGTHLWRGEAVFCNSVARRPRHRNASDQSEGSIGSRDEILRWLWLWLVKPGDTGCRGMIMKGVFGVWCNWCRPVVTAQWSTILTLLKLGKGSKTSTSNPFLCAADLFAETQAVR